MTNIFKDIIKYMFLSFLYEKKKFPAYFAIYIPDTKSISNL